MYLRKLLNSIVILRRSSSPDATLVSARKLLWTWQEEVLGWSWHAGTWIGPKPLQKTYDKDWTTLTWSCTSK